MQLKTFKNSRGFTLAELTIAMAIFSLMLLVMTAGILQLYRIYAAGHQIRDTQEAARTIAQQITDDTHDSLAVAVGTDANGRSTICLYKTIQQQNNTLTGVEYYISAHDSSGGPLSGSLAVHRSGVTTTYNPATPPGCGTLAGNDTVLTSNAVVVKVFAATTAPPVAPAISPRLINLKMSVESAYAQQPGDFIADPRNSGFDQCNPGANTQYCSITNIQLAALSHSETSL